MVKKIPKNARTLYNQGTHIDGRHTLTHGVNDNLKKAGIGEYANSLPNSKKSKK